MKRDTPMRTLVAVQCFVTSLCGVFYALLRPALLTTYASTGVPLPWHSRIAFSLGLPLVALLALVICVAALRSDGQRAKRLQTMSVALGVNAFALIAAALSAVAPLLR